MCTFEYNAGEYCDTTLVFSSYECGYDYSILLYTHGVQYIARKGELYIDDKLVLGNPSNVNNFVKEYASCFNCVIICEDGGAVLYQCPMHKPHKIKIKGVTDVMIGKFA